MEKGRVFLITGKTRKNPRTYKNTNGDIKSTSVCTSVRLHDIGVIAVLRGESGLVLGLDLKIAAGDQIKV